MLTQYIVVNARFELCSYAYAAITLPKLTVLFPRRSVVASLWSCNRWSFGGGREYSVAVYHSHVSIDHPSLPETENSSYF